MMAKGLEKDIIQTSLEVHRHTRAAPGNMLCHWTRVVQININPLSDSYISLQLLYMLWCCIGCVCIYGYKYPYVYIHIYTHINIYADTISHGAQEATFIGSEMFGTHPA